MQQKIILQEIEKPKEKNIHKDIDWICNSLGLVNGRDLNCISSKIVFELLERIAKQQLTSSESIANDLKIAPARVNHHIRNLSNSGFVYREKRSIHLRRNSLKETIDEIRKDANRILDEIKEIAKDIDKAFGLKNR